MTALRNVNMGWSAGLLIFSLLIKRSDVLLVVIDLFKCRKLFRKQSEPANNGEQLNIAYAGSFVEE